MLVALIISLTLNLLLVAGVAWFIFRVPIPRDPTNPINAGIRELLGKTERKKPISHSEEEEWRMEQKALGRST